MTERLSEKQAGLKTLADAKGGVAVPRYTNPREVRLQSSPPALAQYVPPILTLDQTLMLLDGLWFAGVRDNKPLKNLPYDLRRLLYGMGRELIDLERRARESVDRAGKHEVMQEADSETNALVLATGSLIDEEGPQVLPMPAKMTKLRPTRRPRSTDPLGRIVPYGRSPHAGGRLIREACPGRGARSQFG